MQSHGSVQPRQEKSPLWRRLLFSTKFESRHWPGGIKLKGYKSLSCNSAIRQVSVGKHLLAIPLEQGRGRAQVCVEPGDYVLKGQVIGIGGSGQPWVHASTSGRVVRIGLAHVADARQPLMVIFLQADGRDQWLQRSPASPPETVQALADYALKMGLVGLGGAGFPTGIKLSSAGTPDLLLINGAECEPFLSCDDRLMRERAPALVRAADYLASLLGIEQTRFGVENNKPEAIAALRSAVSGAATPVEICTLPTRYPAGGQPMLVKSLTGRRLPPGTLPAEIGVLVINVATLYALGQAVFQGEPLISRILTLTGACDQPANLEVPLGFPVPALKALVQVDPEAEQVQVGGPMMGRLLPDLNAYTSKTSNCLIFGIERYLQLEPKQSSGNCIRCTRCIDVCPMSLQPLDLFQAVVAEDEHRLQQLQLDACIECGCCSSVCPSGLPLRDSFRQAKEQGR